MFECSFSMLAILAKEKQSDASLRERVTSSSTASS